MKSDGNKRTMHRESIPRPTDGELSILNVLWQQGPSTVREVLVRLEPTRAVGYTTVLKLMQIMVDKGLLVRDESQRSHVYAAAVSEGDTQRQLLDHLMERAFGGSARKLVQQALSTKPASARELAEIRSLLDHLEKNAGD